MTQANQAFPAPQETSVRPAVHAMLANVVDYAGLFPPAGLEMAKAVERYASYRKGEHQWMLGRFIVPASRLPEFEQALASAPGTEQWKISCLLSEDFASGVAEMERFESRNGQSRAVIDSLELRAPAPALAAQVRNRLPAGKCIYFEVPLDAGKEFLLAIRDSGAGAKIRCGGLKPEAIPPICEIAAFLRLAAETRSRFKATAGLHHPLRSVKPLTYDVGAPRATMHGFLNMLLASGLAYCGASEQEVRAALTADSLRGIHMADESVSFGGKGLSVRRLVEMRGNFMTSFGSCSFEEPVDELHEVQVL